MNTSNSRPADDDAAERRTILDAIPAIAWSKLPDGSNEFVNQRWQDYTGISAEQARGQGWQAAVHPEDLPKLIDKWTEIVASGQGGEFEGRLRRHDGVFRWILARFEPVRDDTGEILRWYGTSTDIDALKQAEEKLREDERALRRITDAIPQAIVILDPDGLPTYANLATLEYTGLTMADVVGSDFRARIFHPEDLERIRDQRQAALAAGVPFEFELRALSKDGQYRWFLTRYKPFYDEHGRLVSWYATGTDIDERKRAEERIRSENIALREEIDRSAMLEEIVGSSDALRHLLAQVAKVAPTDSTVLISGETGTGKELIARAIHRRSPRSARAFIRVNCAAIAPSLIASELFGHEKGAFRCRPSPHVSRRSCPPRACHLFRRRHDGSAFAEASANAELQHGTGPLNAANSPSCGWYLTCSGPGEGFRDAEDRRELRPRHPGAQAEWSSSSGTSWGVGGPDRQQTGRGLGPCRGDVGRRGNRAISVWE